MANEPLGSFCLDVARKISPLTNNNVRNEAMCSTNNNDFMIKCIQYLLKSLRILWRFFVYIHSAFVSSCCVFVRAIINAFTCNWLTCGLKDINIHILLCIRQHYATPHIAFWELILFIIKILKRLQAVHCVKNDEKQTANATTDILQRKENVIIDLQEENFIFGNN